MLDANQIATALTCVLDASLSAVDPSGAALRRAHFNLREGLRLAEEMNAANNDAASIIREVVASISESEQPMTDAPALLQRRFALAEHTRAIYFVTVEESIKPEDVLQPDFWRHVASQIAAI